MRRLWAEVDSDSNSQLDIKEVEKLLLKLNCNYEKSNLKQQFEKYDKDKSGGIDFKEFQELLSTLKDHSELSFLFRKYANPKTGLMHAPEILAFCHTEQGETDFTLNDVNDIIAQLVGDTNLVGKHPGINEADFAEILFSKSLNNIVKETKVTHDMTLPLASYLAFSSHNTYLTGH